MAERADRGPGGGAPGERELLEFLLRLGAAMNEAGNAVSDTEDRLSAAAAAYGADRAQVVVFPTTLLVALGPARSATFERTPQTKSLRLDQTAALFQLSHEAEEGAIDPAAGLRRIDAIRAMRPRFGPLVTILGHAILTVGLCLVLQPTAQDVGLAAIFGALVALLKIFADRYPRVRILLPVLAAFGVATVTFLLMREGWNEIGVRALIAPLVTFLPGGVLTMGTVELASAEMIAGASRIVYGSLQLLLLAFGIVAGAEVVGVPTAAALTSGQASLLGWWAPWVGVFVFGVGTLMFFSAPRGSLAWLLVVLYAAYVGQVVGTALFTSTVSGFVGALVMTPVAYLVARRPSGPPSLVTFLPAFWLLVPGALGLIGVTGFIGDDGAAGIRDFLTTIGAIVSIALGVLCGVPLYRGLTTAPRLLRLDA